MDIIDDEKGLICLKNSASSCRLLVSGETGGIVLLQKHQNWFSLSQNGLFGEFSRQIKLARLKELQFDSRPFWVAKKTLVLFEFRGSNCKMNGVLAETLHCVFPFPMGYSDFDVSQTSQEQNDFRAIVVLGQENVRVPTVPNENQVLCEKWRALSIKKQRGWGIELLLSYFVKEKALVVSQDEPRKAHLVFPLGDFIRNQKFLFAKLEALFDPMNFLLEQLLLCICSFPRLFLQKSNESRHSYHSIRIWPGCLWTSGCPLPSSLSFGILLEEVLIMILVKNNANQKRELVSKESKLPKKEDQATKEKESHLWSFWV